MKHAILILSLGLLSINLLYAQDFVFSQTVDLNSDQIEEEIKLESSYNTYEFRLLVNDRAVDGKFIDGDADGFKVIDINTNDKYKEIAVHTPGSSSDDVYVIYWYDGKEIVFMDRLSRWPSFNGNGIVYVNNWEGFWSSRDKYVLDNSERKLKKVEQFAYYVGITITVKNGFEIFRERDLKDKVALLSEGSEIILILCDKGYENYNDHRYLIRSTSGLLGWVDFRTIWDNTEGIHTAD